MHSKKCFFSLVASFFLSMLFCSNIFAQQEDSVNKFTNQLVISARAHYGFIFAHSIYVQNTADAKPRGFELEIAKQFSGEKSLLLC